MLQVRWLWARGDELGDVKGEGKGLEGLGKKNGKGLDNVQGKGVKIDGKVIGSMGVGKDGRPTCSYCGKVGHDHHNCFTKHPEQLPWKRTLAIEWECLEEEHDIGGIEKTGMDVPPELELRNRYQVLADADDLKSEIEVPIGTLDIEEVEECEVQAVTEQKARKLVFARKERSRLAPEQGSLSCRRICR